MPASLSAPSFSSSLFSFLPTTQRGQLRRTLAGILSSPYLLYALFFSPLGLLGFHHAWLGHWRRFLAYLITFGLWGGGWLYDVLHWSELVKEQHAQQHKPAGEANAATSPCKAAAEWALRVEGEGGSGSTQGQHQTRR